ncbi:MAG: NADPH-dependent FMN reductase, partial [Candidatus Binatia bacterium]
MAKPTVRRQTKYVALTKAQFRERFFARFYDPAFDEVKPELERVFEKAWDGYIVYRKSPRKKPAGKGFADPTFALPFEWLDTRANILAAAKRQKDP